MEVVIWFALAAVAFTPEHETIVAPIVNGSPSVWRPETVALVRGVGNWPYERAGCTGTLITPEVVLTAAHCVDDALNSERRVAWGAGYGEWTHRRQVIEAFIHPEYDGDPRGMDMAVLQIVPEPDRPTVWFDTDEPPLDTLFTSVGFGVLGGVQEWEGGSVKREVEVRIDRIEEGRMISVVADNPTQGGVCTGDSGGPVFRTTAEGRLIQSGIHSTAQNIPFCDVRFDAQGTFADPEFILEQVARIHQTDDICEARGANTDIWCDPECPDDLLCFEKRGGCQVASVAGFPSWFVRR